VTPASGRPREIFETLKALGFRVGVGVPDSWIGGLMAAIDAEPSMTMIRATHEEEALAIACGARLGGARTVLVIQNVGLLTMGSGLVALAMRYQFSSRVMASRAPKGSSMTSTAGSWTRARHRATRCCIPPDSSYGIFRSKPRRPDQIE
jgi:sulfopyruvate decarboxylase TPP-binding subunit